MMFNSNNSNNYERYTKQEERYIIPVSPITAYTVPDGT